mmetsp:Transcript_35115/g.111894  ORF Transcript_35115/g.111894 Transcript_35115/m.111894 type:complete len:206 (-) Transcript_35115:1229-1846(-)
MHWVKPKPRGGCSAARCKASERTAGSSGGSSSSRDVKVSMARTTSSLPNSRRPAATATDSLSSRSNCRSCTLDKAAATRSASTALRLEACIDRSCARPSNNARSACSSAANPHTVRTSSSAVKRPKCPSAHFAKTSKSRADRNFNSDNASRHSTTSGVVACASNESRDSAKNFAKRGSARINPWSGHVAMRRRASVQSAGASPLS